MLPLRTRARPGEPGHSAALRLSSRQGLSSLALLAAEADVSVGDLLLGRADDRLALLAGRAPGERAFVPITFDVPARTVSVDSEQVLLNDFSLATRRWCAACLRDDVALAAAAGEPTASAAWSRPEWDLRSVAACPRHLQALIAACPACLHTQDWLGPAVDRCRCGADLAARDGAALTGADVAWETFVTGRLGGGSGHPLLAGDPLRTLTASVERLGYVATGEYEVSRSRVDPGARAAARQAAMSMLADWPAAFSGALDRVASGMGTEARPRGLVGAYGWIYGEWAMREPVTALDREVRVRLREHALARGVVARGEPLFGEPEHFTITMTVAARACGMGYERARRLMDQAGVIPDGVRRGVAFPLDPDDVAAAAAGRAFALAKGAAATLGVGRSQERALRAAHGSARTTWAGDLLSRLEALAGAAPLTPAHRGLPDACRAVGVPLATACEFALARSLAVAGVPGAAGLHGMAVLPAELRRLGGGRLGVEAAARHLGVHPEAARALVRAGALARCRRGGVDPASVDRFARDFVAAAALARMARRSPRALIAALAAANVVPRFAPPACRQAIYARKEAEAALLVRSSGGLACGAEDRCG